MSLKLLSRSAGMLLGRGRRTLEGNLEMHCVGPLMFDTFGLILISMPVLWVLIR